MKKPQYKFESEVHLGLLVIIFILLFLNFAVNYTVYLTRSHLRVQTVAALHNAAVTAARTIEGSTIGAPTVDQMSQLKRDLKLTSIALLPSRPGSDDSEARDQWLATVSAKLRAEEGEKMARRLLDLELHTIGEGDRGEFYYLYPLAGMRGKRLLALSQQASVLGYLEEASNNILYVSILATLVVAGIYVLLLRYIFAPFRRIQRQAIKAGRPVENDEDGVRAVVDDYEKIIDELRAKERELLKLNEAIRRKADSLEQFNQYILSSTDSGVITLDNTGRVLSVNTAAEKILGIVSTGHLGADYYLLLAPCERLTELISACLKDQNPRAYTEYETHSGSGDRLYLGVTVSAVTNEIDLPVGWSLLINDLTEVRRLRDELETQNRLAALGEMSGGLAHQLRNSLGAIVGFSRLIGKRMEKSGLDRATLESLDQEAHEAEMLIERFLVFVRPLHPNATAISLQELLVEVVASRRARVDGAIEINIQGSVGGTIQADALLLKQALGNIIDNAVDACVDQSGSVTIKLEESAGHQVVRIIDTGCGIPPENLEMIFTPFFSSRPSGNGLGLPLAAKIIDLHGGHLSVTSEVGQGTEFTVRLPIEAASTKNQDQLIKTGKIPLG